MGGNPDERNRINRLIDTVNRQLPEIARQLFAVVVVTFLVPAAIGLFTGRWSLAVIAGLAVLCLVLVIRQYLVLDRLLHSHKHQLRVSHESERALQAFLEMDDSLFRLLSAASANGRSRERCRQVLRELLRDFSAVIGKDLSREWCWCPKVTTIFGRLSVTKWQKKRSVARAFTSELMPMIPIAVPESVVGRFSHGGSRSFILKLRQPGG